MCCSRLSRYLSSTPIWLILLDKKRLIVTAVLSVLISWVKPLSGHASVHVVKAIYEQWPDMKPRLLRSCKQPHLFEPTCSPVFTIPVNNEISPAYYYCCIRNITAAWTSTLSQKVYAPALYGLQTHIYFIFSHQLCTFIHSAPHSFISVFIYLYISPSVCFHFSPLNLATPCVTPRVWAKTERRAGSEWSLSLTFTGGSLIIPDWRDMAAIMRRPQVERHDTYCIVPQWIYVFSNKRKV